MTGQRAPASSPGPHHGRLSARFHVDIASIPRYASVMSSTAFASEAVRIREVAGLSDRAIGEAVGAPASTVRDWLAGRSSPTGQRARRVAELAELVDRLLRVMEPGYVAVWLVKPIEALDDHAPVDLIAAGKVRDVARVISGLEAPGAV